jgi:hypothetical protein
VVPFAAFVRSSGYGFWRPEILLAAGALVLAGAVLGAVARRLGTTARVLVVAALVVAFVDVQTDVVRSFGPALLVLTLASIAVAWLLREHLATIVVAVLGTALVATLLLPPHGRPEPAARAPAGAARSDLPVVLHLILDEQIGLDGIPLDMPGAAATREWLLAFWASRGFRVFGRAYSRYYETHNAISNLLNLAARDVDAAWFRGRFREGAHPEENAWLAAMAGRGHAIHVYQTDFLDLCGTRDGAYVRSCFTYDLETIAAIADAPFGVLEKARVVTGVYRRLSFLASGRTEDARPSVRVAPLAVLPVLDRLAVELARARPGDMLVAHLMLPHHPYAFDRECGLRPLASWGTAFSRAAVPLRNTPASRAASYPFYLDQVVCLHRRLGELLDRLRDAGTLDRATIVVHGDHGSRIEIVPPNARFAETLRHDDYVDAFSTLFAVKAPGFAAGYDGRQLPAEAILAAVLAGDAAAAEEDAGPPDVFLNAGPRARMVRRPMPPFGPAASESVAPRR